MAAPLLPGGLQGSSLSLWDHDPKFSTPITLRQVSGRVGIFNQKSGSATRSAWRSWQMSYVPLTALRIGFWNGFTNGSGGGVSGVETGTGGPLTVTLSIEYPRGTFTRITGSIGGQSFTIPDNSVGFSDLFVLPFVLPAFAWFRICGDFQMLSGGTVPSCGWSNACDRQMGDEYQVNTTQDYTMTATVLGAGGAGAVFPQLVLGLSDLGVWGIVGDSIAAGVNDTVPDPSGGRGMLGRGLAKSGLPHLNYGVPGDRAMYAVANYARRLSLMKAGGVTATILQLGVNDLNSGARTSAQLQADRASIRTIFTGLPVYDTTVTPSSASVNGYINAAGQSPAGAGSNTQRISFNDALRAGLATGSAGLIDVSARVETDAAHEYGPVLNGGVWLPKYMSGVTPAPDGVHGNSLLGLDVAELVEAVTSTKGFSR